jgi:hypothetical protein
MSVLPNLALAAGGPSRARPRATPGAVAPEKEELCLCGGGQSARS